MILLAAAILANLVIAVCFKLFKRMDVDHFTAIVVNYWASAILGSVLGGHVPLLSYDPAMVEWIPFAIALSAFFIIGFTVTALSVRYAGMAVTTAMQRMSLLVSASYALVFFGEAFDIYKLGGMILAIVAIILITRSERNFESDKHPVRLLLLPIGTLLFSGIIESVLYHVHAKRLAIHGDIVFTTYAFSVAACVGTLIVIFRAVKGLHNVTKNDLIGGLALGIPNFFTIYLILTLLNNGFPGSVLYPVLNILVLTLTAIVGLTFFREKLSKGKVIGIGIALLAILLISIST
jgi:drug/metabolite transporter (DMT)-like permease